MPEQTDRLAEIQTRAAKATEGPWEQCDGYGPNFYGYLRGEYLQGVGDFNFGQGDQADADREFTIHARDDIEWLIGEVQTLRTQLATAERQLAEADDALADRFAIPGEDAA